jgi:hypothetical protein
VIINLLIGDGSGFSIGETKALMTQLEKDISRSMREKQKKSSRTAEKEKKCESKTSRTVEKEKETRERKKRKQVKQVCLFRERPSVKETTSLESLQRSRTQQHKNSFNMIPKK